MPVLWFSLSRKRLSGPEKNTPSVSSISMKMSSSRASEVNSSMSSRPAVSSLPRTNPTALSLLTGKYSAWGEPAAISARAGSMTSRDPSTASNQGISPPSSLKESAKAPARLSVYTSPLWAAAALVTPFSWYRYRATAAPWSRSLSEVR